MTWKISSKYCVFADKDQDGVHCLYNYDEANILWCCEENCKLKDKI